MFMSHLIACIVVLLEIKKKTVISCGVQVVTSSFFMLEVKPSDYVKIYIISKRFKTDLVDCT